MSIVRSAELWQVAYFLSKCGERRIGRRRPKPPIQLQVASWEEAYSLFFPHLHGGRALSVFCHSLKNARDMFDGHHDSGRIGWRQCEPQRSPQQLNLDAQRIMDEWKDESSDSLWQAVRQYADDRVRGLPAEEIERLAARH